MKKNFQALISKVWHLVKKKHVLWFAAAVMHWGFEIFQLERYCILHDRLQDLCNVSSTSTARCISFKVMENISEF